jgi:predicted nucleotidyltransferase
MANLKTDALRRVLETLHNQFAIRLALVFGSVAAGTEDWESDLDIAVDVGRPLTPEEKLTLITQLAQETGRPVDLIDLRTAGEPMLGQILKHGVRLLGSNASYADLIRRHLFESADFLPYRTRILEARRRAWIAK